MTRTTLMVALVALAGASLVVAQDAGGGSPMVADWSNAEMVFGASSVDVDTTSSKFFEYRDVPNGAWFESLLFEGRKGSLRYDFRGRNIRQADERYAGRLGNDVFRLEGFYDKIPHRLGNEGRTILANTAPGVWRVNDTLQQSFQAQLETATVPLDYDFLSAMVAPSVTTGNVVDIELQRERANVGLELAPRGPLNARVVYSRERRVGTRAASGTAFGFGNVVELPETMAYLTQDVRGMVSANGDWGTAQAALSYNWFQNNVPTFDWDNPFRATDSTDGRAYLGPGSSSINGPVHGLMALPPDNEAVTGSAGVTFKLPARTRVMADASIGRWTQSSTSFIGYTTNTAIETPALPVGQLDGKADVTAFSVAVSSKPARNLSLNARYRRYDLDNQTPRISLPGYVRFDAVWEEIPRISVPYGYTNDRFQASLGYDLGLLNLEAGYKMKGMDRTFRETDSTSDTGFFLAANARKDWVLVRATYEKMSRDYEGLHIDRSEHASFQDAEGVTNLLAAEPEEVCGHNTVCNLRFDQAKRDLDRLGAQVQITPGSQVTLSFSYFRNEQDFPDTEYGLQESSYDTFSIEGDLMPTERVTLNAYYTRETIDEMQTGRQSGGTVSLNPLDNWTSSVDDTVSSVGFGAFFTLVPDKWKAEITGSYQKVDGDNRIDAPAGGAPANARPQGIESIASYDDSKLMLFRGEVQYSFAPSWTAAVGAWIEDYEIKDAYAAATYYAPASFFLAANDGDYQATVAYVSIKYNW